MRDKLDTADVKLGAVATRQHGVIAVRQLIRAGLTRSGIERRVKSGRLHPLHRGVYAVGHTALSIHGKWTAAVLACGQPVEGVGEGKNENSETQELSVLQRWGAAVSHHSAASLWGMLPVKPGPVHVTVPSTTGRRRRKGIHLHRSRTLDAKQVTSRAGIPVTTPARTIAGLRRTASPAETRRAIRQSEVLGLRVEETAVSDRTRSELEALFLRLCRRSNLPRPEINVPVGPFLVDFLWRDRRLIVETDGYRYHGGQEAFEADRDRDLRLKALGYEVIRLSYRQVVDEPQTVTETLSRLLASTRAPK